MESGDEIVEERNLGEHGAEFDARRQMRNDVVLIFVAQAVRNKLVIGDLEIGVPRLGGGEGRHEWRRLARVFSRPSRGGEVGERAAFAVAGEVNRLAGGDAARDVAPQRVERREKPLMDETRQLVALNRDRVEIAEPVEQHLLLVGAVRRRRQRAAKRDDGLAGGLADQRGVDASRSGGKSGRGRNPTDLVIGRRG